MELNRFHHINSFIYLNSLKLKSQIIVNLIYFSSLFSLLTKDGTYTVIYVKNVKH